VPRGGGGGKMTVRMQRRSRTTMTRLKELQDRIEARRELRGRWLYVREILKRDGAIGVNNYEYLLMHVSMHQALEAARGQNGRIGRRRRRAMGCLETELHEYGEHGRYETDLHDLLRVGGDMDAKEEGERVLAVLYGWRTQGTAAARYTDHTTIAASEDGYTRLVRGEAWAVERARAEGARRAEEDAVHQVACSTTIPDDLLASLWNPQRDGFYHHPARVVDAARRLQAGGRGSAMSSEQRRSP